MQIRTEPSVLSQSLFGSSVASGIGHVCTLTTLEGLLTTLLIVPMTIRARESAFCIVTYALLDKQSNPTFCSCKFLDRLRLQGKRMTLKLTLMGRTEDVCSMLANSLVSVRLGQKRNYTRLRGSLQTYHAR